MNIATMHELRDSAPKPYATLSDAALTALIGSLLKHVSLAAGEVLHIDVADGVHYLSVLEGAIAIDSGDPQHDGHVFDPASTDGSPIGLHSRQGQVRLHALEATTLFFGDGDDIDDLVSLDTLLKDRLAPSDEQHRTIVMMRAAKAFAAVPSTTLIDIHDRMEPVVVVPEQEVVRQDTKGDAFFFILEGRAEVWQETFDDDEPHLVATLGPGDAFGEEALIVEGARNATVRMISDGRLLSLDPEAYRELIATPSVERIDIAQAQAMIEDGAQLVDVRYDDEVEDEHIPGCLPIPLHRLRQRMAEIVKDTPVVVYCRSGRRSQVGALLLKQHGYTARSMDGGILAWPGETIAG